MFEVARAGLGNSLKPFRATNASIASVIPSPSCVRSVQGIIGVTFGDMRNGMVHEPENSSFFFPQHQATHTYLEAH